MDWLAHFVEQRSAWQLWGLALQLLGTAVAAIAVSLEWLDRTPKAQLPKLKRPENPWKVPSTVRVRPVFDSDRRNHDRRVQGRTWSHGGIGLHPDVEAMAVYLRDTNREDRERMGEDWVRQDAQYRALHDATVKVIASMQAGRAATQKRVLVEMLGLVVVAVGTVLSTI